MTCRAADLHSTVDWFPELCEGALCALVMIPVRMHCSSKSTGLSSSSEAESSGKISIGSGRAGGDLISFEK